MRQCLFLSAGIVVLVHVHRERGDRLGQGAHTGVDTGHLHGGTLVDRLTTEGAAEKKRKATAVRAVLRLVARPSQTGERVFVNYLLTLSMKKEQRVSCLKRQIIHHQWSTEEPDIKASA